MENLSSCLQPSELCDFDRCPAIVEAASRLAVGRADSDAFEAMFVFVKAMPYGLEDWDLPASDVLKKGWGMCSGKSNLLVAMARSLGIPARYRVYRIRAESRLLEWVTTQMGGPASPNVNVPAEQDHVDCEAYIDGSWKVFDPSRDPGMERGLLKLGMPLERVMVRGEDGLPRILRLDAFDTWARARQQSRLFREGRESLFVLMNEQINRIRQIGNERISPA